MALTINSKADGTTVTLELTGRLSTVEATEFNRVFPEKVQGMQEVLLDFSNVEYISSLGLRSLFMARKVMMRQGGGLKILYPRPEVMEVFEATSFDNIVTIVRRGEEASARFYPLRPVQRWMVDTHFMVARSTMMNAGGLIKMDPSVDMERLAGAVNSLLADYDIFRCRLVIHPETGDLCQRFDGEVDRVVVETLSDEAFEQRKLEVKQPYELIDHPLYRIFLMQTASAKYAYMDFYHAVMDGTAIALLFWRELDKRYRSAGKPAKVVRKTSSYAEYILEEARIPQEELQEGRNYWRQMLADFDPGKHLPPPDVTGESEGPDHEIEIPFPEIDKDFFKDKNYTENTFFMGAALLALAKSAGSREAIMGWVHNGRVTMSEMRLMGLMLDQFPIRWEFREDTTSTDYLSGLEAKISEGMQFRKSLDVVYTEELQDDCATFILQKGSMGRRGIIMLDGLPCEIVEMPANEISAAENILDIEMNARDDGSFSLVLDYDNSIYSETAMRRFGDIFKDMVIALRNDGCVVTDLLK